MVSLTRDNVAKDLKEVHLTVQPPDTIIAPKSVNIPTPGTTPDVELVSEPPCTSTQHRDHVGWLFESSDQSTYTPRERGISEGPARHAPSMYKASATFQSLPTEIHFRIAAFLPDHALHVLARLKYSARLRNIYKKADPQAIRTQWRNLSGFDKSVLQELLLRDAFEKTCKADNPSITSNKGSGPRRVSTVCLAIDGCSRRTSPRARYSRACMGGRGWTRSSIENVTLSSELSRSGTARQSRGVSSGKFGPTWIHTWSCRPSSETTHTTRESRQRKHSKQDDIRVKATSSGSETSTMLGRRGLDIRAALCASWASRPRRSTMRICTRYCASKASTQTLS